MAVGLTVPPGREISRVGVVGAGMMGAGIAEVCARASLDVVVCERDAAAAAQGRQRVVASMGRARDRNKLDDAELAAALERLSFTDAPADLADRQLVIEAVVEEAEAKLAVFAELDRVVAAEDAILASNTSSIPIVKLAMATERPEQVVGVHFFNPAPVMRLVELVTSLHTSDATAAEVSAFVTGALDKVVIRSQDRAGFVVNTLLVPYLLSAIRMLESGFASAADIDIGMVEGCGYPMGPLALVDLIGLDTTMAVSQSLYDEFKEPLYAPPPLLSRMVDAGLLGRKSGRGFHAYG